MPLGDYREDDGVGCQDSFMHHHNAATHPSSFIPIFF